MDEDEVMTTFLLADLLLALATVVVRAVERGQVKPTPEDMDAAKQRRKDALASLRASVDKMIGDGA